MTHFHDISAVGRLGRALGDMAGLERWTPPPASVPPSVPTIAEALNAPGATAAGQLATVAGALRAHRIAGPELAAARGTLRRLLNDLPVEEETLVRALAGDLSEAELETDLTPSLRDTSLHRVLFSLAHLSTASPDPQQPGTWEVTVTTQILTDLDELKQWVDPRGWDECSEFFIKTHPVGSSPPLPNGTPWAGLLLEKAGWVLDIPLFGELQLVIRNHLDIQFDASADAALAQYSLGASLDGLMSVNEGHFSASRIGPGRSKIEGRKKLKFEQPLLAASAPFLLEPFMIDQLVRVLNAC